MSSSGASSAIATISVRGVITSRTGRWVKVMHPTDHHQLLVGVEPDRGPLAPDGAKIVRPRSATPRGEHHAEHDDQRRSTGTSRSVSAPGSDGVSQRGTK